MIYFKVLAIKDLNYLLKGRKHKQVHIIRAIISFKTKLIVDKIL